MKGILYLVCNNDQKPDPQTIMTQMASSPEMMSKLMENPEIRNTLFNLLSDKEFAAALGRMTSSPTPNPEDVKLIFEALMKNPNIMEIVHKIYRESQTKS